MGCCVGSLRPQPARLEVGLWPCWPLPFCPGLQVTESPSSPPCLWSRAGTSSLTSGGLSHDGLTWGPLRALETPRAFLGLRLIFEHFTRFRLRYVRKQTQAPTHPRPFDAEGRSRAGLPTARVGWGAAWAGDSGSAAPLTRDSTGLCTHENPGF